MSETAKLYRPLDDYLKRLKRKVKESYSVLYVSGFDELHIIRLAKRSESIYEGIDEFNRDEYLDLVEHARMFAESKVGKKLPKINLEDFINEYLNGYDPITQYVYTKELDRKRMRMNESILTAREYQDIVKLHKAIKKAADLIYTQSSQYGLDLMLAMIMHTYEESGVVRLRWNTVIDGRECHDCHELNGKVFPIDEYPEPQHYGCRCYPTPVFD